LKHEATNIYNKTKQKIETTIENSYSSLITEVFTNYLFVYIFLINHFFVFSFYTTGTNTSNHYLSHITTTSISTTKHIDKVHEKFRGGEPLPREDDLLSRVKEIKVHQLVE
jgi:hypothetical protein